MGAISKSEKVKLIVGMISAKVKLFGEAEMIMSKKFGSIDYESPILKFDYTDYYAPEMGSPLTRRLAAFEELIKPEKLPVMKNICVSVEADLATGGRRAVNIDPGILSADSFVLASTKKSPHRICLAPGRYAEVTLLFHHGVYHALPWTYPDYAGPQIQEILVNMRRRYLWQLSREKTSGGENC